MMASPQIVQRCIQSGVLDSGGGLGHFTAHVVAAFIELGLLDDHVKTLRAKYLERRNLLIDALADHLPKDCHWMTPQGGFYVWLRLPEEIN
ncbi:MAG: aminotransferase class I/II-fold pyridoxal phosphate-dependent enzyme, partial [Desulfobacterales bacterium]|nr:aminotransferase class I/II-fold pyridoxal phosphate-dependent enzyme [Desulfobacterales bacterium]